MSSFHDSLQVQISQRRISEEGAYQPSLVNPLNRICLQTICLQTKAKRIPTRGSIFFCKFFYFLQKVIFRFNETPVGNGKFGKITKILIDKWSENVGVNIIDQIRHYGIPVSDDPYDPNR